MIKNSLISMQINKDSIRKFENIKFTELEIYEPLKNLEYGSILLAKNLRYFFSKKYSVSWKVKKCKHIRFWNLWRRLLKRIHWF